MGDIADDMIDGFLDFETGEFIDGDAPGYPRTIRDRKPKKKTGFSIPTKTRQCGACSKKFTTHQGVQDHYRMVHLPKETP